MPHRASMGVVFAIVLIDMLGFGIVMPVLPQLIMDVGHIPVDSAAVYAGTGQPDYARTFYDAALGIDPAEPSALKALSALAQGATVNAAR